MKERILAVAACVFLAAGILAACAGGPQESQSTAYTEDQAVSETASEGSAAGAENPETASGGATAGVENPETASEKSAAGADNSETASEGSEARAENSESIDTGNMIFTCPEGWLYAPQKDLIKEPGEDGEYPLERNTACLIKGGEDEYDIFDKPYMYIYLVEGALTDNQKNWDLSEYDTSEEIICTIDGEAYDGYLAEAAGYNEKNNEYAIIYKPLDDKHYFRFLITTDIGSGEGIALDDADFQTIFESVMLSSP